VVCADQPVFQKGMWRSEGSAELAGEEEREGGGGEDKKQKMKLHRRKSPSMAVNGGRKIYR